MSAPRPGGPLALALALALALTLSACTQPAAPPPAAAIPDTAPEPLTAEPGDPVRGQAVFVAREGGHCVLCHAVSGLDAPFQGNVGPALDGVGSRLTEAQIRFRLIDISRLHPDTVMPPYFRTEGLNAVASAYDGKTVLTGQEIEDLIAYLGSLKGPADAR